MAKKKEQNEVQTEAKQRKDLTKFCAFWGITLAALLFLVNGILKIIESVFDVKSNGLYSCMAAFDFVAKLGLLVAVGIPAYAYVRKKKLGWKITYVVAIVIYAAFCVYHLF